MSFPISLLFALILIAYTHPPQLICFLFLLSKGQCWHVQHPKCSSSPQGLFSLHIIWGKKKKKSLGGEQGIPICSLPAHSLALQPQPLPAWSTLPGHSAQGQANPSHQRQAFPDHTLYISHPPVLWQRLDFFFFFFFKGLYLHMEVPRLGVKSELQLRPTPQL